MYVCKFVFIYIYNLWKNTSLLCIQVYVLTKGSKESIISSGTELRTNVHGQSLTIVSTTEVETPAGKWKQ